VGGDAVAAAAAAVVGADHHQVAAALGELEVAQAREPAPAGVVVERDRALAVAAVRRRRAVDEERAVERAARAELADLDGHHRAGAHLEEVAGERESLAELAAHLAAERERAEDRHAISDVGLAAADRRLERRALAVAGEKGEGGGEESGKAVHGRAL